jgi:hypothetical protein
VRHEEQDELVGQMHVPAKEGGAAASFYRLSFEKLYSFCRRAVKFFVVFGKFGGRHSVIILVR